MPDLISTSNTWPNYSTSNVQAAAATKKKDLGKDQFLSILVAQLKNQDPTAPMDNAQFVAQMAQFSSVEQLISINEKMDKMQGSMDTSLGGASELIGKKITWLNEKTDAKTGATTSTYESGTAESIILKDKVLYAQVGEDAIPLSLVTKVEPATASAAATSTSDTSATSTTPATTTPTTSTTTTPAESTPTTGSTTTPATSTATPASTSTDSTATSSTPDAIETKASDATATPTTEASTSNDAASSSTAAPAATATGSKTPVETNNGSDSSTATNDSSTASAAGENAS
ncbi:flagellar hook capping FlgD N-terminal domain-containing protein [Paenibacillus hunanensis]|uniref:flagellar hook assembly protein FlgD n=1 Tax=Paenibacillus hunanensis TaxID=539262 RepID=UPI002A69F9D3|nr:flagellar hook capping FlgD N-terminal domain-containing protein [Paenibacillus hunanensis]WPP39836.1 flagellar hook capping FlgD N-terminal domain-containing protein [Paenibacillus hunanensis]